MHGGEQLKGAQKRKLDAAVRAAQDKHWGWHSLPSSQMNAKVFINYRREDSAPYAGRLYDRLSAHFGEDQVFIDIDQIQPGEDFVEVINRKVSACDVAIVAIGPRWLGATDVSGKRRLDDEEDFVRMEIVAALQRQIRVIPVLVGGAQMPRKPELPEALAPLSRRNAIEVSEMRFHGDVNRLIEAIEKSFAVAEKKAELSATPAAPVKSSQTMSAPLPIPSTSSIAAFKESKVWTSERRFLISGLALLLFALAGLLMWRAIANPERVAPHTQRVAPNPDTLSKPAEAQSVDQGNATGLGDARALVVELYRQGADQGNADAQVQLGDFYKIGDGVPKDLEKARELYQKAADQGNADAQERLGTLYYEGQGVPKDVYRARELYQKAADQGNADALFDLGRLYENADGVPKDLAKAKELYQKAVEHHSPKEMASHLRP